MLFSGITCCYAQFVRHLTRLDSPSSLEKKRIFVLICSFSVSIFHREHNCILSMMLFRFAGTLLFALFVLWKLRKVWKNFKCSKVTGELSQQKRKLARAVWRKGNLHQMFGEKKRF